MNNRDAHIAGVEEERGEQEEPDEPEEEDEEEEEEEVEEEERQGKEERNDEGEDNRGDEQDGEQGVGVSVRAAEEEEEEDDEKESGHDVVVVDGDGDGTKEDQSENHPVMEGGTPDAGLIVEEERGQPVAGPGTGKRGIAVGSREEEDEGEDEEGEDEEDDEEEEERAEEVSPGVLSEAERGTRRSAKALAAAASMHELSSELFPLLVERLPEVLGQDPNFDPPGKLQCITKLAFLERKMKSLLSSPQFVEHAI